MHNQALVINNQAGATMSSLDFREIINAERLAAGESIVENSHFLNRIVDEIDDLGIRKVFVNPNGGRPTAYYNLTLDQCMLVGMRESKSVRRKVLAKLKELESKPAFQLPNFSNPAEAARAWANQVEEKQAAIALIEQQKPAVEFVERYVAADSGSKGFRQVAKLLAANELEFRAFLSDKKVMYRLGGEWMPHQNHIDAGRFEVKTGLAGDHAFNQAKFTAKGVNWISGIWAQYKLEASQ